MKVFKRYLPLIIFVGITLIGLLISYYFESVWEFWANLDSAFAVALGVLAFMGYLEYIKSEDEIKIYFETNGRKIDTGLSILRKDCTRREVLGILGMIQKDPKERFNIKYMKNKELLKRLHAIQKGNGLELIIPLSEDELGQFEC